VSEAAQKTEAEQDGDDKAADAARAAADEAKARAQKRNEAREKARAEDAKLVAAAKTGDSQAFRKRVERNQGRLYAVAFGMLRDRDDAMDAVQDAFIKAHKKLVDFEGNAAFSTWLYRICVNLCIDKKRSDARRRSSNLDDVHQSALSEDSPYAELDIAPKLSATNPLKNASNKELGGEIGKALAELSEDHRTIVLLREIDGLSYEEISQVLEIPRGTVMSRLFHARKNLQKLLRPFLGLEEGADLTRKSEGKGED
jgi:RNA polymerase sigma-70 factor (ECF subfamily)